MPYFEIYERLMGDPDVPRCRRAAFGCALAAGHDGACSNLPLPSPTAALEDADPGIGPLVKCAARPAEGCVYAIPNGWRYPADDSCVRSPADGHTLHWTAGQIVIWEGGAVR